MRLLFQVKTRFWNINIAIQYEKRNNWKSISETFLTPLWKPFLQDNLFWHRYWYRHFGEVLIMMPTDYDYSDRKDSCPLWLLRKGKFIKMHLGSEWCRCIEAFVGFTIDLLPPKRCPYINDQSLSKFTIFCEKGLISTRIYICHTSVQDIGIVHLAASFQAIGRYIKRMLWKYWFWQLEIVFRFLSDLSVSMFAVQWRSSNELWTQKQNLV